MLQSQFCVDLKLSGFTISILHETQSSLIPGITNQTVSVRECGNDQNVDAVEPPLGFSPWLAHSAVHREHSRAAKDSHPYLSLLSWGAEIKNSETFEVQLGIFSVQLVTALSEQVWRRQQRVAGAESL